MSVLSSQLKKSKAILGSVLLAVLALGFSFYVLQALYLGVLLAGAGRADTEPAQSAGFRYAALAISLLVAAVVFGLFYRRQTKPVSSG